MIFKANKLTDFYMEGNAGILWVKEIKHKLSIFIQAIKGNKMVGEYGIFSDFLVGNSRRLVSFN